jgi:cell division septum initiation protein DivIVA
MSGTETEILSNIPDLGDDGGSDVSTDTGTPSSGGSEGGASAQPTSSTPAQPQQPQQQVRRRHDGLVEQPNPNNPNTRDLVDPVSGRVVAQGGIERRIYEDAQRAMRENNSLKQQLSGLQNQVKGATQVVQEAQRLGVSPEDQLVAVRVMSDFMRDPVRTLQALVEEVKSKGYQIPFLNEGVSQGMDMAALSRMIDGKLAPIMGRHQQEQQQVQVRQQVERDLDQFLQDNQEANNNLDVLGEMLQAQPGMALPQAWTMMIRWAHQNGLDWTQPLKPQIAAMRQQQTTSQQPTETRRPLPQRSASRQGAQPINGAGSGQQFSESSSWSDIIRSAMEETGTRFN